MIIVLHAGLLEGRLALWAERTPEGELPPATRGRKPKTAEPRPHPFAASEGELASALEAAGLGTKTQMGKTPPITAWLPTAGEAPVASSPLIAETPASPGAALAPWTVACTLLESPLAVELLCASMDRITLAPGVVIGEDLAFWAHALRFTGALVARQHILPGVRFENGTCRAVWEPAPSAEDTERLAWLAERMPPSARALSSSTGTEPPTVPARELLRGFVGAMLDHLVRASVFEQNEQPHLHGLGRQRERFDSLHDQWLHALRSRSGEMRGDPAELSALAGQVRAWRQPLAAITAAPYRLCFRLEEPPDAASGEHREERSPGCWRVRFLLQAADDPSLQVCAEEVWKARGRKAAALRRGGTSARQFLLASLGQAAAVCPRIEASLKAPAPAGYALDVHGAHEFLTEKSALLDRAGFGVMLPAWWTRKGVKQRLSVRARVKSPRMQGGSGLSLERMVSLDWEVALGGQRLSLTELEELARLKAPLVRVRGQWVETHAEELRVAIDFWKKKTSQKATVRDVVRMSLGGRSPEGGPAFEGLTADGWVGELLDRLEGRAAIEELEPPGGLAGTLRPYQGRGYSWLAFLRELGLGACLADDMGLGKTVQTLALIERDWERGERRPVLLVCPTSVVTNWRKEAARFTPELPVMVHHGVGRKKSEALAKEAMRHGLVISSYALLHRDLEHLRRLEWAGVVLDEAQNIKNPETKQSRAARSLAVGYRIALTGTPVENNVGDLWSIMEFLNPGLLGTQAAFRRQFFLPIQAGRDPEAAERLRRLTGPFVLRRLKTDRSIITDLPEKLEMKVYCNLTREQASLYRAVVRETERALGEAEGIQRRGLILATLSKLKQACNHPAQLLGDGSAIPERSGKLARLEEMLGEVLAVNERALIFTQYAEMGEILKRHLQETFGREVLFLHGGVPKARRDAMVERFQAERGPKVFVLSLKAGGTGLNLTGASHVFHFDRWWNPAVENQATDRAFRIGQTRNVQVHKFICAGTLEEAIDEMIERKKGVAEQVVGTGEGWLTELSNDELRKVFALRAEAIGD